MRILGIDPGLERVGYGLIDLDGSRLAVRDFGLIETPQTGLGLRLRLVHEETAKLIGGASPDFVATEKLLFSVNRRTAMDVAKALGVILLAAGQAGLEVAEYSPSEVKQAVVGNGSADKRQVAFMVTRLLRIEKAPKPDDVTDALAIAICHAFRARIPR
jgi:crossover junction endodeoxyribonuclease RuvC